MVSEIIETGPRVDPEDLADIDGFDAVMDPADDYEEIQYVEVKLDNGKFLRIYNG